MRLIALMMIVSLASVTPAEAEIIHFRMTGQITVDFALGQLPDGIYEGAPFQVDLSYDTATPDFYPDDPQRGLYTTDAGPNNFLRFHAGPAQLTANGLRLIVGNDIDGWPHLGDGRPIWDLPDDSFQTQSQIIANFPIATFHSISFRWRDPARIAFASDDLPMQFSSSTFQDMWFTVRTSSLSSQVDQFTIRGIVQDVVRVPEARYVPAASVFGLMLGVFVKWRQFLNRVQNCASICIAMVVCGLYVSDANAEIVRLKLTGKVAISGSTFNVLPDDLLAGADTNVLERPDFDAPGGKRFVAYWSYDTSVSDDAPALPYSGVYRHPLADPLQARFGLSVHIDDYVFRLDTSVDPYTVGVAVGSFSPVDFLGRGDSVGTNQTNVLVPFEYDSPTIIHDRITLSLGDSIFSTVDASSLPSDALPRSLDVSQFDYAHIQIDGAGEVGIGSTLPPSFFIKAWIDEISVVPEPSTLYLLLVWAPLLLRHCRRAS